MIHGDDKSLLKDFIVFISLRLRGIFRINIVPSMHDDGKSSFSVNRKPSQSRFFESQILPQLLQVFMDEKSRTNAKEILTQVLMMEF